MDLFFDNYGSKLSNSGQHFGPSVGCYCVHSALIQSVTVFCSAISLTCGMATKLKMKVKVTLNYKNIKFLTHGAYSVNEKKFVL